VKNPHLPALATILIIVVLLARSSCSGSTSISRRYATPAIPARMWMNVGPGYQVIAAEEQAADAALSALLATLN
jgi:hypothetical protein